MLFLYLVLLDQMGQQNPTLNLQRLFNGLSYCQLGKADICCLSGVAERF